MATRKKTTENYLPFPTKLVVGKDYFKQQLSDRILIGEELLTRVIQTYPVLEIAKNDFKLWSDYNSELLKQSFNNEYNEYKESYDNCDINFVISSNSSELDDFKDSVKKKVSNLKQLISKIELLKSELPETTYSEPLENNAINNLKDIFIVHGHNNEVKINVARMLEKLGLNPIILHEQANEGKTIMEKFEKHSDVGFAIVLLTDDDEGKSRRESELKKRARQNVILELGYFIGRLGRNRVCPLYINDTELPSDLYGLLYVEIDNNENWKIKLVKELKAAGYDVDANKII